MSREEARAAGKKVAERSDGAGAVLPAQTMAGHTQGCAQFPLRPSTPLSGWLLPHLQAGPRPGLRLNNTPSPFLHLKNDPKLYLAASCSLLGPPYKRMLGGAFVPPLSPVTPASREGSGVTSVLQAVEGVRWQPAYRVCWDPQLGRGQGRALLGRQLHADKRSQGS